MTKAQVMWVKTQRRLQQQSEPTKADYYPEDQTRKTVYKIVRGRSSTGSSWPSSSPTRLR